MDNKLISLQELLFSGFPSLVISILYIVVFCIYLPFSSYLLRVIWLLWYQVLSVIDFSLYPHSNISMAYPLIFCFSGKSSILIRWPKLPLFNFIQNWLGFQFFSHILVSDFVQFCYSRLFNYTVRTQLSNLNVSIGEYIVLCTFILVFLEIYFLSVNMFLML